MVRVMNGVRSKRKWITRVSQPYKAAAVASQGWCV